MVVEVLHGRRGHLAHDRDAVGNAGFEQFGYLQLARLRSGPLQFAERATTDLLHVGLAVLRESGRFAFSRCATTAPD